MSNKIKEAIDLFNEAIMMNPYNLEAYFNRALCYLDLNEEKTAIEDFKKCIKLLPMHTKSYKEIAKAYFKINLFDEAFKYFSKVSELDPFDKDPYFFRSLMLLQNLKAQESLDEIEKGIKLDPHNSLFIYQKAKLQQLTMNVEGMHTTLILLKKIDIDLYNDFKETQL